MACVNPDGTMVSSAKKILETARTPGTPTDIAERSGFPRYRVHSALRELLAAGLVSEKNGTFAVTPEGVSRLAG